MSGLFNIFYDSSGQLYVDEASPMIKAVQYLPISREVEVLLSDGSRHAWRVDDLEMLANVDGQIVPLSAPTREQLIDVVPYGGGAYLYWPQIEQMFELDALLNGVYQMASTVVRAGWKILEPKQ